MKTSRLFLLLFLILGLTFCAGSFFDLGPLLILSNFLLVPFLLGLYLIQARRPNSPMITVLLLFFLRDLLLVLGIEAFGAVSLAIFLMGLLILILLSISGFQKSPIHPVEYVSFFIMYGFLAFLFIFIGGMVPEIMPDFTWGVYLYLLLLMLFLAISFTGYLVKSHFASLWLMLSAASLLISELSLFFRLYIIEDLSVNLFYPVFHVFSYYAIVEHALHRRRTSLIPSF